MHIWHDKALVEDCRLITEDCIRFVEIANRIPEDTTQEERVDYKDLDTENREYRRLINQKYEESNTETRAAINRRYASSEKGKITFKIANLKRNIDNMNQTIENKKLKVKSMQSELKSLEYKRESLNELC